MPTSEARIAANRRNALKSTGPRTAEGKARSRANAVKHNLAGEGVVLLADEVVEVDQLQESFEAELQPTGEVGRTLVRRLAWLANRMERCAAHESAAVAEQVRRAVAEFDLEWPEDEDADDPERERLREAAADRALFDPSKEATLARKYEAAAERGFFRALKELRQVEQAAELAADAPDAGPGRSALGSFLNEASRPLSSSGIPILGPDLGSRVRPEPAARRPDLAPGGASGPFDIPFAVGRAV